jgi:hypothetical protein
MSVKYRMKNESSDDNLLSRYNAMFEQPSELPFGDKHRREESHPLRLESKQRVSCPVEYCNSSFSARKSLWRHMLVIHNLLRDQSPASVEDVQRARDIREGKRVTSRREHRAGVGTDGHEFRLLRSSPVVAPDTVSGHRCIAYDTTNRVDRGIDDDVGDEVQKSVKLQKSDNLPTKSLEMSRVIESDLPEDMKVLMCAQTLCNYIESLSDEYEGNINSVQVAKEKNVNKRKKKEKKKKRLVSPTRKQKSSTMKVDRSPRQTKSSSSSWVRL